MENGLSFLHTHMRQGEDYWEAVVWDIILYCQAKIILSSNQTQFLPSHNGSFLSGFPIVVIKILIY